MAESQGFHDAKGEIEHDDYDAVPSGSETEISQDWTIVYEDAPEHGSSATPPERINVAAVSTEDWIRILPKNPVHAAYYAGRLWNSIRWLQDLWVLCDEKLCPAVIREIDRLKPFLSKACRQFLPTGSDEFVWDRLVNRWTEWRFNEFDARELQSDPAENITTPSERLWLRNFGIDPKTVERLYVAAIRLGIGVDRAFRRWQLESEEPLICLRTPWIDSSLPCTTNAWRDEVAVLLRDVEVEELTNTALPASLRPDDVRGFDLTIQSRLAEKDFLQGDKNGVLDLILNQFNWKVRRRGRNANLPVYLSEKQFRLLRAVATARDGFLATKSVKQAFRNAGYTGNVKSASMRSNNLSEINSRLERLGVEIVAVWRQGWRLEELTSLVQP
jgi:hypothetical protein